MPEKTHILYMEDNEGTARLLQKRLERVGYTIDLAPNGEVGLERCAAHPYDAVIVDFNMPGLNGIQIIQRLIADQAMLPTIMLTGTGNEHIAVEALKLGAFDYVIKDIDGVYLDLLPTVIEQALKNRQLLLGRKQAEESLERSEKYYRALIENSLDLVILTDKMGSMRYISPAFRDIFGFDEREIIGQNGLILIDANDPKYIDMRFFDAVMNFYQTLLENPNQSQETQFRVLHRDGSWKWLEVRGRNLLHEPWIESIVFNIRDITERKEAEEALRDSEERFRMLFELAPDPYFINDLNGNLIDVNQAVEPLLGLKKDELVGKNFVDMQLFEPDELAKIASILVGMSSGSNSRPPELTVNRTDGKHVSIDLHMIPIQSKGETQILGIGHDITWRKQAETQMKTHIERLEILRQIDDELTRKLDIQYVQAMALDHMMKLSNANAGRIGLLDDRGIKDVLLSGYPDEWGQDDSLGKNTLIEQIAHQQKAEWIQDVTADPHYSAHLPDTYSQMIFPLHSQNRLVGIVILETICDDCFNAEMFEFLKLIAGRIAVAIDNAQLYESRQKQLIELTNLYEKISRLEQLKTDMIRLTAHDLRNPLTAILMKTYLLRKTLENQATEKQQGYINAIDETVGKMQALISDFLSIERIEELTQSVFNEETVNLCDLVRTAFTNLYTQADEKSQVYRLYAPETALMVRGGKAELQQVIVNIIENAIKYTPNSGTIEVSLQGMDNLVRFEVVDTGYGIPLDQQEKLFQPFFRAQTDETKSIEGTGLGLYLVKKIIERNKGQMIFHSEYGQGSTFGFELPITHESAL